MHGEDGWIGECMVMDGRVGRWFGGQMGGWEDGWVDKWEDR